MEKKYSEYTIKHAKKTPIFFNCLWAFFVGGSICSIGQVIFEVLIKFGLDEDSSKKWVPILLIVFACFFTGIGLFDKIAKKAGAGTLVPITGFANAMCSPAVDNKAEGWVLGVGAKMFVIAGPVIVYGVTSSMVYGFIYWLTTIL